MGIFYFALSLFYLLLYLGCLSVPQEPPEDEANIVEKILSVRRTTKEVKNKGSKGMPNRIPF